MLPVLAEFTAVDGLWVALSILCVVVAATLGFLLVRLAATVRRLTSFIQGLETELLPVINKAGGTVDRVNAQLDKVDRLTDSAVDVADNVDSAVRTLTTAVRVPVQKLSGLAAGLSHGFASLRTRRDPRTAWESGRAAAGRREQQIEEELEREQP